MFPTIITIVYYIAHDVHKIYTYNYTYTYSIFILRTKFHVARMQTKFFRSCPHHIKGWAGLVCSAETRIIRHRPWLNDSMPSCRLGSSSDPCTYWYINCSTLYLTAKGKKLEVKIVSMNAMEGYPGVETQLPLIFLDPIWMCVVSFTSRPLYSPGKSTEKEAGWAQQRVCRFREGRNLLALPEIEPWFFGRPDRRKSLYWLSYPGSTYCSLNATVQQWHNPKVAHLLLTLLLSPKNLTATSDSTGTTVSWNTAR